MSTDTSPRETIAAVAQGNAVVFEELAQMTLHTLEHSGLDPQTYMLVRLAALVALDAAPVSYLLNIGATQEAKIPFETVQGMLVAIAPVVGSARVVSAASKMMDALAEALGDGASE